MLSIFNSLNDLIYNLSVHTPLDLLYVLLRTSTESLTIPSKTTLPLSLIIIELSLLILPFFKFTSYFLYIHILSSQILVNNNFSLYKNNYNLLLKKVSNSTLYFQELKKNN